MTKFVPLGIVRPSENRYLYLIVGLFLLIMLFIKHEYMKSNHEKNLHLFFCNEHVNLSKQLSN